MHPYQIQQFRFALNTFYDNPGIINNVFSTNSLNLCKSSLLVLSHILNNSVDSIELEIYCSDVSEAVQIFKNEQAVRNSIFGDFYNDLRVRYLRLLNVEPKNNTDAPTSEQHLAWMLVELGSTEMSETKKHRWLGYIQGCMVMKNLITVQEERDLTRGIFNGK